MPVDYLTGVTLCRIFQVSPHWLATGNGSPSETLHGSVFAPVPGATGRTLFSEVYASHLRQRRENAKALDAKQTKAIGEIFLERASKIPGMSPAQLGRIWQEAIIETGAVERDEIENTVVRATFGSPLGVEFQNELDVVSGFDDKQYSMLDLAEPAHLIDEVKALTAERGAKSRLAKRMGVSRQRLNEWLSGRSKPSARYLMILQLQVHAMKRAFAAKKSAAHVGARATRQTRKGESKHETTKSDQRKIIGKK
ncbi:MAG: helix-turn-helix domain-containing protein [Chthoniobacterales bacterium]